MESISLSMATLKFRTYALVVTLLFSLIWIQNRTSLRHIIVLGMNILQRLNFALIRNPPYAMTYLPTTTNTFISKNHLPLTEQKTTPGAGTPGAAIAKTPADKTKAPLRPLLYHIGPGTARGKEKTMPERKNEATWIESRNRWQINVQMNGVRKTFTSSIPGRKGKAAAERKADSWLEKGNTTKDFNTGLLLDQYAAYLKEKIGRAHV